jgi:putative spermidine/putrescine transport system permease protein
MGKQPFLIWFVTPAAVAALLFLFALAAVLQFSFREFIPGSLQVGAWTLANLDYITRPLFVGVFLDTVAISFYTALFTLLIAYPLAYALVRASNPLIKATILVIAITPLFTGEIVRTYAWIIVLGNNGFINTLLVGLGIASAPIQMMFTTFGVVVALVHFTLPIMVVMLAAALSHIDPDYEKAAKGLGAGPIRAFVTVTLPLSMPGIIAGATTCFAWTFSAFATPQLIGGGQVNMVSNLVYQLGFSSFNFPVAAVLSLAGMILTLLLVGVLAIATRPLEKLGGH